MREGRPKLSGWRELSVAVPNTLRCSYQYQPKEDYEEPPKSFRIKALWGVPPPAAQPLLRRTWVPLLPAWPGLPPMQVRSTSIEGSGVSHPAPPKSRVKKPFCFW
jgi:hypothetical protein